MGTEQFFRLLSIALLGLIALVALPETQAEPVEATAEIRMEDELKAVLEVNEINAGRFSPHLTGEDSIEVSELDLMPSTRTVH